MGGEVGERFAQSCDGKGAVADDGDRAEGGRGTFVDGDGGAGVCSVVGEGDARGGDLDVEVAVGEVEVAEAIHAFRQFVGNVGEVVAGDVFAGGAEEEVGEFFSRRRSRRGGSSW